MYYLRILALWGGLISFAYASPPADPLKSVQWETMHTLFLQKHPVQFDETIHIFAPKEAEDSLQVPVVIDARALEKKGIEEILVFADFNPLPKVLSFYPKKSQPFIAFRIKIQQATPIRAAVRTKDGWHVNGMWVDAAGGGCTLPSLSQANAAWEDHLNEVSAGIWKRETTQRVRFQIIHPMDTGLATGIPVFHLEQVQLWGKDNTLLAEIHPQEPVSENPIFTLDIPLSSTQLALTGVDNNGNEFAVELKP